MKSYMLSLLSCLLVLLGWLTTTKASPIFDDRDWRSPAVVTKTEGIERELTPELLLKTELKSPVLLFDPTDDESITAITSLKDTLYVGSCTRPANTDTGTVFTYDPYTDRWQKVFKVNDEGLTRLEVYGDRLYIPGYDADDGGWDLGNIYIHDGKTWVERRTVPRAIHEYGLAVYKDRIYVSADILDPPPAGMTLDQATGKGLLRIYGRVVSSGDGGLTWREEYRGKLPTQDIGILTVFGDRLVLNASGDIVIFDGKRWKRLGLNPNAVFIYDAKPAGDTLLLGTSLGLCFLKGDRFTRSRYPVFNTQIHAVANYGTQWILAGSLIDGTYVMHGPGGLGLPHMGKFVEQPPDPSVAQRYVDTRLWFISESSLPKIIDGSLAPENDFWQHVSGTSCSEMVISAHAFKGRVYLGTHPEGRVMVLPVVKEGTLDSAPRAIADAGTYTLTWEAATPAGTSCRLQVRSAATKEALEKQLFVGPDGTNANFFEASGATVNLKQPGFAQYRVLLKSENPALTPYVRRVRLGK